MTNQTLKFNQPNDAWILQREEIETSQDGVCNIYVLLDAHSTFCFGQEVSANLPEPPKIIDILKSAHAKAGKWPKNMLILKKDPFAETLRTICERLNLSFLDLPAKDLEPYVRPFKDSFRQFKRGAPHTEPPISEDDQASLEAFIPDSYGPCPCASGKKFKFCCQKAFKDITFAMCAAQEGNLDEALRHMKQAETKVGRTAEIVCRYSACWSFFDMKKSEEFLNEAIALNPNHPRTNYILGIEAVAKEKFEDAIRYYETAISHYPKEDKFHLNETYNNLGTAYFQSKKYKEAKEVWERALVLLPSDQMVKENLFEFIYGNPALPKDLREISPFIERYLGARGRQ